MGFPSLPDCPGPILGQGAWLAPLERYRSVMSRIPANLGRGPLRSIIPSRTEVTPKPSSLPTDTTLTILGLVVR